MSAASPLRPGDPTRVGDHLLQGRLGAGGQGVVYLGRAADGTPVAVKVLHEHVLADEAVRARFAREVAAAANVAPFCVARVLGSDLEAARPYIVSEYVEGPSLRQAIERDGPRSGAALHRLAVATATALAAVHEAGVVHRDFKPDNVLLGADGPRVIDFGIARGLGSATVTKGPLGTPAYMSPEQLNGERVGPASDVFAWGCVLVFAATGRPPFGTDSLPAVVYRVLRGAPDLGALDGPLRELAAETLRKLPEERPSMREVLLRLLGQASAGARPGRKATGAEPGQAIAGPPSGPEPSGPPAGPEPSGSPDDVEPAGPLPARAPAAPPPGRTPAGSASPSAHPQDTGARGRRGRTALAAGTAALAAVAATAFLWPVLAARPDGGHGVRVDRTAAPTALPVPRPVRSSAGATPGPTGRTGPPGAGRPETAAPGPAVPGAALPGVALPGVALPGAAPAPGGTEPPPVPVPSGPAQSPEPSAPATGTASPEATPAPSASDPPDTPAVLPASFAGVWQGAVRSDPGQQETVLVLAVRRNGRTVIERYPGRRCTGTLRLTRIADGVAHLERVAMRGGCVRDGTATLAQGTGETLQFSSRGQGEDSRDVTASGTLERRR
ncbi:protein kinase [Planomonospora corallina]|uniref:non-specific serine/threonine protein kinase n=1 Tax=Planomonospora corallina TaxID=1806052 RepID=A0ABV8I8F7_9ACTN